MTTENYLSFTHPLLQSVTHDGKTITEATAKPMTFKQYREMNISGEKLTLADRQNLMVLSTDLPAGAVAKLTTPDFNSLYQKVHDFYMHNGYTLSGKERDPKSMTVTLWFSGGEEKKLRYPTLQNSIDAEQYADSVEQAIFIIEQVTDLESVELDELPLPDFMSLNDAVTDFLYKSADFFQ
ncbi:phage tail assembly protein [Vibrio fluvialis]|nr:phage tail assembly protein [Vibrio fluvialis]